MANDNDVRIRVRADDDTRQGFTSATDRIRGGLEKLAPAAAAAGAAMAAGLAVATTAAALLKKALDASIERSKVGNLVAAQLGDTSHAAELGKLAGRVYADGFGEGLEEAGQAVRDVMRNRLVPEDAADDAIRKISEKVLTVGKIAEVGSAEVSRSVHKMLVTGLAGSAEEALDIITRGVQQGADEAGDLLDTFDEYSIQFKALGLNGKEALGLLSQGLKGGARDADTVADALKEIVIRAKDGSKASIDAFKSLGLDAKQLATMFASGGDQARKALDMVIDKTKMIKDPVEKNALAIALFGTKAEDLQSALFGLDLDTAAAGLGDVAGAADKASAALHQGLGPTLEKLQRQVQQGFADVGDKIAPYVMEYLSAIKGFAGDLGEVFKGSEVPGEILDALRDLGHDYLPAVREGLGYLVNKVRDNKEEFEAFGHVLAEYVIPAVGWLLVNGVKVAANAIGGLIDTFGMLWNMGEKSKEFAINLALTFINSFDLILGAAVKAFSWIPGIGPKLDSAVKDFHEFVGKVNNELLNIRDRDVYVRTHFVGGQGQSRGGEYRTGGITGALSYAATGGVRGGLVMVGEEGRELIRTPTGSSVYPKANANQLLDMSASSAPRAVEVRITGSGSWWEMIMEAQRDGRLQILATAITP